MSKARSSDDRAPTAQERYLASTTGSNLRVTADRVTDADALLAAGIAASGDARAGLALDVYRVLANSDMRGARSVAERMAGKIVRRSRGWNINRVQAIDLAMLLLKVWHQRACPECSGRGHPLLPGTPVQDDSIDCPQCNGNGEIPLERIFKPEQVEAARWLESEINSLSGMVFIQMARLLSSRMDL